MRFPPVIFISNVERWLPFLIGFLSIALGAAVIVGWHTQNMMLANVFSQSLPMEYNTSLGFLFSGVGLLALSANQHKLAFFFGAIVTVVGAVAVFQYFMGNDFGIDQLLPQNYTSIEYTQYSGRMGPSTALSFSLIGLSILFFSSLYSSAQFNDVAGTLLGVSVFLLSALALYGYVVDVDREHGWGHLIYMAVHTFLGFFVLSICITIMSVFRKEPKKTTRDDGEGFRVRGVVVAFAAFATFSVFNVGISYLEKDAQHWVEHTIEVNHNLQVLLSLFNDAETGQRGFLITQKESYLLPYRSALNKINPLVEAIGYQTSDNPEQQKNIARIKHLSPIKLSELKQTIDLVYDGKVEKAYEIVSLDLGKNSMDDIRKVIDTMQMVETNLLEKRNGTLGRLVKLNVFAEALVLLLFIIVILYARNSYLTTQRFKESRQRLNTILDNAGEGIYGVDIDGRVTFCNKAAANFLGHQVQDVQGQLFHCIACDQSDSVNALTENCILCDDVSLGVNGRLEKVTFRHKSGVLFPVSYVRTPIMNDKNELVGAVVVFHDVSEQHQAEQEREKFINTLSASNEELERFAFVCSHDLQEPLRMISSFSEKLQQHIGDTLDNDEKASLYLKFMTDGAIRAQDLIKGILSYSKISHDTKKTETVDTGELLDAVQESLVVNLEEYGGKITHDVFFPLLQGNRTQIYQLLYNLINNAIKYQQVNVEPLIHVGVEERGEFWAFSVADNGIGMEEKHQHKIFEIFQRLHHQREYSGTGIGLSLCKKIVEHHGGEIWVESEKGKGSVFYFTLLKVSDVGSVEY